jgi:hypothetical protein
MEDDRIMLLLRRALDTLLIRDNWLIENDLCERCITHKLAEYLQSRFQDYNVDCEYNGDIDREDSRKRIEVVDGHLDFMQNGNPIEGEIQELSVFPDIIIHKRGTNESNLCIIEVKKANNPRRLRFDRLKVQAYTSDYYGNNLNYQLGVLIIVTTGNHRATVVKELYKSGNRINIE